MTLKNIPLSYKGTKKTLVTLTDGDEVRQRVFDPTVEDVLYVSAENAERLVQEQPKLWALAEEAPVTSSDEGEVIPPASENVGTQEGISSTQEDPDKPVTPAAPRSGNRPKADK